MTEIQNSKQLVFELICNLMLVICYFRFTRVRLFQLIPSQPINQPICPAPVYPPCGWSPAVDTGDSIVAQY